MQMSQVETDAEIQAVLDKPDNMAIVNCSKWSPTQPITPVTKSSLLQELIYEKVVDKRHKQIAGAIHAWCKCSYHRALGPGTEYCRRCILTERLSV